MKEELQSAIQFPGLQIFSSWKNNQRNRDQKTSSKSQFASSFLLSEETLSSAMPLDSPPSNFNQWRKFSDRNSIEFHDYSPTVVNSDSFERPEVLEKDKRNMINIPFWDQVIGRVFNELPFCTNDQFLEEFQYAVISSDFLNGFRFSFALKESIMDFHKRSEALGISSFSTFPTKYGRLKASSVNKFYLVRTFDYFSTIFLAYKVLRSLHRLKCGKYKSRRIVATLLIALYLAIQQEYFHTQYTKYKALITLKTVLASLKILSSLLYKYHIRFKELIIYKPLASAYSKRGSENVLSMVKDLLTSNLDLLYYKLKIVTQDLLALSDTTELAKYCEIYNLEISDLFHYLNEPATEVEDKAKRVHILKKFMLCCLLSLNSSTNSCDLSMHSSLSKIFPNYHCESCQSNYINEVDKFKSVTNSLEQLNDSALSLTSSLIDYKSLLHSTGESPPNSNEKIECETDAFYSYDLQPSLKTPQLSMTLHALRQLENTLIASTQEEITNEVKELLIDNLQNILKMWQNDNTLKHGKRQTPIKSSSHGFSLDIIKRTQLPAVCKTDDRGPLRSEIEFRDIEEAQSDIESDMDIEQYKHDTDMEICYENAQLDHYRRLNEGFQRTSIVTEKNKFQELSDEELRCKLNEGILKFAVENKQGRDKLRTQKSFELLRKVKNSEDSIRNIKRQISTCDGGRTCHSKSRPLFNTKTKFSSEETIPMLYELKELIESSS